MKLNQKPEHTPEEFDERLKRRIERERLPHFSELDPSQLWLSTINVGKRIGKSQTTVIDWFEKGTIPGAIKIQPLRRGSSRTHAWVISEADLKAWQATRPKKEQ